MSRIPLHLILVLSILGAGFLPSAVSAAPDDRFFAETSFRVDNDAFWTFFQTRGRIRTFGYPVSRTFKLQGFPVQIFQRAVLQLQPDGSVATLNLLDDGLLPLKSLNGSTFPVANPALIATAPRTEDPQYAQKIQAYVRENVPDEFEGQPVAFGSTFASTVTAEEAFPDGQVNQALLPLLNLQLWGAPTSRPARDPRNPGFIYQRFQRGIMHYDQACRCTQGLLLGDSFKSVLTGRNLPADLRAQVERSPFLAQYAPNNPLALASPHALPESDLRDAFTAQEAIPQPDPPAAPTPAPAPEWRQLNGEVPLWSGPDGNAIRLGTALADDYLQVTGAERLGRLPVLVKRTGGPAWVDASATRVSGPPPANWPPPPPETFGWVATHAEAPLSADADGKQPLGLAPQGMQFEQVARQQGQRMPVRDPLTNGRAWIDVTRVGPIGAPANPAAAEPVPARWWGRVVFNGANLRTEPKISAPSLAQLPVGTPIVVEQWVAGEEIEADNVTWAKLAEGAYIYSSTVRSIAVTTAPPLPADAPSSGKWIDINLTHQVLVAYEGTTPVRIARTSTGRPSWETPAGRYAIQRRVENETMDSNSLIGLDASRAAYRVENVRWTQYFSADGMALHENYWKPKDTFGIPGSHGCAGLIAEDAKFLWDWAAVGTSIYVHP